MRKQKAHIKMTRVHSILLMLLTCLIVLCSCDSKPNPETERAWQQSFRVALIDGYTNFKGHLVDADTAVYIFSYEFPPQLKAQNVLSTLRKQISDYTIVAESKNELVLKRIGKSAGFQAFDEYRFLLDEQHGKITVMFASIDSPVELKNYPIFVEKFQKIYRAVSKNSAR